MRRTSLIAMLAAAVLLATSACGLIPSIPGIPGTNGGTAVGALWPDVPTLPDSTYVDTELPLPVRLAVQAYVAATDAAVTDGNLDDFGFVVYDVAPGPDLAGVYSPERMAQLGWLRSDIACTSGGSVPGALCAFAKGDQAAGSSEVLAIVLSPGAGAGGRDQVAYIRIAATQLTP